MFMVSDCDCEVNYKMGDKRAIAQIGPIPSERCFHIIQCVCCESLSTAIRLIQMHASSKQIAASVMSMELDKCLLMLLLIANVRPCMLVDGDRWLNKTRFDAQYEHGIQPVGM
jgi:hypothetical protein